MISHADLREMIGAYAVGALDQPELTLMEEHLGECAFCANLAREAGHVGHQLAFATAYRPAPQAALDRLLTSIHAQPVVHSRSPRPASPRRWPRFAWPRAAQVGKALPLAAGAVVALGVAGWNVRMLGELHEDHQELASLHQRMAQQSHLLVMVTSQAAVTRPLESTALAPSAQVRLIMDGETNTAMLMANRLPPLPQGQIYEVWLGRQGARMPAARLDVDQSGDGECTLQLDASVHSYDSAWITLEPADGGFMPNSPGVARGTL